MTGGDLGWDVRGWSGNPAHLDSCILLPLVVNWVECNLGEGNCEVGSQIDW